eukprot:scaffold458267_cov42-Prasinocladus_malaysianus.AAC.1
MAPATACPSANGNDLSGKCSVESVSETPDALLARLLPQAVGKPRLLQTDDGGAAIVAALHCLMVE